MPRSLLPVTLLVVVILHGSLSPLRAVAASPAPHSPREAGHASRIPGLSVVEALLEDLQFRSLALYDHDAGLRPASPHLAATRLTVSRNGPGAGSPLAPSSAPAAGHGTIRLAPASNLATYLGILARRAPHPEVTGRFSDWRTPSVYRLAAGLHHGYDVAYGPRTPIAAGWPGRVTSVVNWYGSEYGITVLSTGGFQVTYGHLSPTVRTGSWINVGDIVGTVVNDHVDVKMRDLSGRFIDFAHGLPGHAALGQAGIPGAPLPCEPYSRMIIRVASARPAPETRHVLPPGPAWTRDRESVAAAVAYLRCRHDEFTLLFELRHNDATASQALLATRQRLEAARQRLVTARVPEAVLLAALLENEDFRAGRFASGEPGSASLDPQDDAPHLQAVVHEAEAAVDELRLLFRHLDTPAH